tara:strand:- start:2636 stop:2785 length:150 start_codon:yes stop_codon:yes gene_type:complete
MGGQGGLANLVAAGFQAQAWCLSARQQDGGLQWLFSVHPKYQALHISRR